MDDKLTRMVGEALQKASLFGMEMCREAVTKLRDRAQEQKLPPPGGLYVEGLNDALEMIETVFTAGLETAIREKAKHDEQASREPKL